MLEVKYSKYKTFLKHFKYNVTNWFVLRDKNKRLTFSMRKEIFTIHEVFLSTDSMKS